MATPKKVLLINTKNVSYTLGGGRSLPLGISYIAAVLEKAGHSVRCRDFQVEDTASLPDDIAASDIVGISALTPNITEVWRIARLAKEAGKMVLVGGPHVSVLPDETLLTGFVDIVCRREGEYTAREVVNGETPLERIQGISYVENGIIKHNPDRPYIADLDELPYPRRSLLPVEKYEYMLHRGKKVMNIMTSRGCPCDCNFCYKGISGRSYRMRSVENILGEWRELINMGADEIPVIDDSFTVSRPRIMRFCEELVKQKLNIHWEASSRVDNVDLEMLQAMKRSGCYRIAFGIESGSQRILDLIGKHLSKDRIIQAVRWAQEAGLEVTGFFVIGNFGEDESTMNATIDFAKQLKLDYVQFTIAAPYPGTKLYDLIKAEGKFLFSQWHELGSYSGTAYFEQGALTRELVEKMFKKAYRSVYLTPGMIMKKLMHFNPQMLRFWRLLK